MSRNILTLRDRFDFTPLLNDFIGFDSLFDKIENSMLREDVDNFPPYDIYTQDVVVQGNEKDAQTENHIFIEFALAGLRKENLQVEFSPDHVLTIKTITKNKIELAGKKYIRKGIAERNFCVQKTIDKDLDIVSCKMNDGILVIEFKRKNIKDIETQIIDIE